MIMGIGAKPIERPGCHELDDLPGLGKVKGEGSQHHEGTPGDRKAKPLLPGMKFNGGIGTAPMPGGQKKEKKSGRERKGSPQEEIEARES